MGLCVSSRSQSKRQQTDQSQNTFQQDFTAIKLVEYFDSQEVLGMMNNVRSGGTNIIQEQLHKIYKNNTVKNEDIVGQVQKSLKNKSEQLLRSYKDETREGLKVLEKTREFIDHYYKKYLAVKFDPQIVKKLLLQESIQAILESIVIVNTLLQPSFQPQNAWWTKDYFLARKDQISSTFPPSIGQQSLEKLRQLTLQSKEEITSEFLKYLQDLKMRLAVSISIEESQDIEVFKSQSESTNIQEKYLNNFYQQTFQAVLESKEAQNLPK